MASASEGALAHHFELGGDVAQGHIRIGHGDARDQRHQTIFRRLAPCPLYQMRLG